MPTEAGPQCGVPCESALGQLVDNSANEKAMLLDRGTHPAPKPVDSLNQLCGAHLLGRSLACR